MRKISIVKRFPFITISGFIALLILSDIFSFIKLRSGYSIIDVKVWLILFLGIVLLMMAIFKIKAKEERIGFTLLYIGLIINPVAYFMSEKLFIVVSIILEICAIYCFYLFNKTGSIRNRKPGASPLSKNLDRQGNCKS